MLSGYNAINHNWLFFSNVHTHFVHFFIIKSKVINVSDASQFDYVYFKPVCIQCLRATGSPQ